ncbi:toprim domain-containing protein [Stenotrophomonas indicatrix]|uniref:Toprim domain-containing protein n=1 Tax=Stenotrophomonas indicatrix TaxID=2045451 RepID=A0ABT8QI61_9GAMM|nr:toprim domain-containing protein [Stenotrophomonas indicatrix]MDN8662395.1 toprim domain-containing protein [Stenotrophomonas indicatrix]MDN8670275.1 toprim domain-containing protein [Stenotrophomonas indicatrix]
MQRTDGFIAALRAAGLLVDAVKTSGTLQRVRAQGDSGGQRSGWYVLHVGPPLAGAYGNWKTGASEQWCERAPETLSTAERAQMAQAMERLQRQQQAERHRRQAQARQHALARWQRAEAACADHPYLIAKGVGVHGLRQDKGQLLIPLRDGQHRLWSLQTIGADGAKRFLSGGRKRGLYYPIGPSVRDVVCIAEGFATAASIHEATGHPTAVAFDAGNMEPVARVLRDKFPNAVIVVCADDDAATALRTGINPGVASATRAAEAVGGVVAMPPRLSGGESR